MGAAAYNRGTRALSLQIRRDAGLDVHEDRPARKPTQRPADWGAATLARAVERARSVIVSNRRYGREVSPDDVVAIVAERERCSAKIATDAARIAFAEIDQPTRENGPAMSITNDQAFKYATRAIESGLTLRTPEMTAGRYHEATGNGPGFAVFVDMPYRHGPRHGLNTYFSAFDVARVVLDRYGRGATRKLVVAAYERAGMTPPALPAKPRKRGATARSRK